MSEPRSEKDSFTLGLDAGLLGRWGRLILGSIIPLLSIFRVLVNRQPSIDFLLVTVIYFAVIFGIYLSAYYFLGERFLAHNNPWI
jgi:hypothetical protein